MDCEHKITTRYTRLIARASRYEPAEYDYKIICNECGEELDESPDGAEETEATWDYQEE